MKPKSLFIVGAGSLGSEVCSWAFDLEKTGDVEWRVEGFLDDFEEVGRKTTLPAKYCGTIRGFINKSNALAVVSIGDPILRKAIQNLLVSKGLQMTTVIHPTAVVNPSVRIGVGSVIGPLSVVGSQAQIGTGVFVNSSSVIQHDVKIGSWAFIGAGVNIGDNSNLDDMVSIMSGQVIPKRHHIRINK